jgi:hypothetical protein
MASSPKVGTDMSVQALALIPHLPIFIMNLVYQRPNLAYVYPNIAAVLQNHSGLPEETDASWCSGQEDCSGFQSCALRQI